VRARPNLPKKKKKSNVVVLERPQEIISQCDLEEYFLLEREIETTARWKAKRDYILELLRSGARVEAGVHTAEIELKLTVR
jgi:hypothetical protein